MERFSFHGYAQDIRFGVGSLDYLSGIVDDFGMQRVLLLTSGSQRRNGNANSVESALSDSRVDTFERVSPHVQIEQVLEVTERARELDVDGIVGLGGGSVLGMAKAVSDALHEIHTGRPARDAAPLEPARVPTIAIPITYAGSEMTTVYGITRPVNGVRRKMTVSGRNIAPRAVIYDPALTLDLPREMTTTSAMNALAHCFEALYSLRRNPLSTAVALSGIQAIGGSLPTVAENRNDIGGRIRLLEGAFLAGAALSQVAMAIHHGVCHVLGGSAGVPHGVANSIVLPHALRFNRDAAARELSLAAIALGVSERDSDPVAAAQSVIAWLEDLTIQAGVPRRLRDHGVERDDIRRLAEIALDGAPVKNNPRPVSSVDEIVEFLDSMW